MKGASRWRLCLSKGKTHGSKYYFGRTPLQTFEATKPLAQHKMLDTLYQSERSGPDQPDKIITNAIS
jgi:hypothetical protein